MLGPSLRMQKQIRVPPLGSVRPSVHPFAILLGRLVFVICNSKSFHSFLLKLCIVIVHISKMCTSYFLHDS